jgi:hypothetical protein
MRLSFLDEVPGLMYVYVENGYVDAEGEAALLALERLLNSPTDDEGLRPWTDWGCSRGLAHVGADSSAGSAGIGASPHSAQSLTPCPRCASKQVAGTVGWGAERLLR